MDRLIIEDSKVLKGTAYTNPSKSLATYMQDAKEGAHYACARVIVYLYVILFMHCVCSC